VIWIHASSAARFDQSLRDTADQLEISGREDPQANIFQLFRQWLCESKRGRWLVVLDNADDASFVLQPLSSSMNSRKGGQADTTSPNLAEYFPYCDRGSVLITTRTREVALKMVDSVNVVDVCPMGENHALALLKKKLGKDIGSKSLEELARTLEYMPLAIVQAAAYIKETAPRYSVQQYLEDFRESDHSTTSLLDANAGFLRRDKEASNSIILTWQISFEHILTKRQSATDLLSLMSFFDREAIPEFLLRHQNESQHPKEFEKDLKILRDYAFVAITTADVKTFEMHRLVQLSTQVWLDTRKQLVRWKESSIKTLDAKLPNGEHQNWSVCQALYPHVKATMELKLDSLDSSLQWANVMYKAGWYALRKGITSDAEQLAALALKVRTERLGQEHPSTLNVKGSLAQTFRNQGRWKEAEDLQLQVIEARERTLGKEHPDTLTAKANLAETHRSRQEQLANDSMRCCELQ
jgi:hypothetical protein